MPSPEGGVDTSFIPPFPTKSGDLGEWDRYPPYVQRQIILHYLASISLVDDGVGRVLAALEETGQADNTIVLFTADHGEHLGNHGLIRKASVHYDEILRVPLILRAPNVTSRRIDGLVELVDIYPTLLGLLGIPANPGIQGIDWAPSLDSNAPIGRDTVYSDMFNIAPQRFGTFTGPYCAVQTLRTRDWKLNIYPASGPQYGQLFNLADDPDETNNLYADPAFRDRREEMLWHLNSRVHADTDPLPLYLTQY
jgi:arylsulfatase A-like enzyme